MLQFYSDKRDRERESSTGYYHLVNRTESPQDEREGGGESVWGVGVGGGQGGMYKNNTCAYFTTLSY